MRPELPYPDLCAVYSEVHQALLCLLLYLSSYLQSDPGSDNKIRPQEQPAGVPKHANRAFGSLPCSHKKKRPLMLRLANYVTGTLLLDGPRLHVGVSQNNSANQLAMTGCKVAAQSVACAHHCFVPA